MSHLSILPTVVRDADTLHASLEAIGLSPRRGGHVQGFAGDRLAVLVQVHLADGLCLGWRRSSDGSLALVGDLQLLSQRRHLDQLLARLNRAYAARDALRQAQHLVPDALIQVGA
jgi:hypothetical protein